MNSLRLLASFPLALSVACAPSLVPEGAPDAAPVDSGVLPDGSIPPTSGHFRHTRDEAGIVTTVADATSATEVVYLDLDTGLDVGVEGPWELGFRRYFVITNGGVSGDGGGAAVRLPGTPFSSITRAPEEGWMIDLPDIEEDSDEGTESAFNGGVESVNDWYDYDEATHRLTRRDVSFVVRGPQRTSFKVEILSYYDDAGTPGMMTFRWAPIASSSVELPDAGPLMRPDAAAPDASTPPLPADAITVDASNRETWVYLSLSAGVVSVSDPETSTAWDLALRRSVILTNSGVSGIGVGGARDSGEEDPARVSSTGTLGFEMDQELPSAMPGGPSAAGNPVLASWYDYDPITHALSPAARVYVIRTASGSYGRLRVWRWVDGVFQLSFAPIEVAPETVEFDVDASGSEAWTYVDLHAGAVVSVSEPAADDARWDLGLRRTQARTQSGTTSAREGGALDAMVADPSLVEAVPAEGFVVDTERAIPGPPGSPTYSGNAALETWFDYDPMTHVVSPRATTFVVRLADGSAGRLDVRSWSAGIYRLRWTYAGPGRAAF